MKYRALIVDDEHIILNGIMRLPVWLSMDIQPVPAMSGMQALKLIEHSVFDMVITDIKMPEMDGLELIAALKKMMGDIPVVVLSGYDSFEYAKKAIHYGIEDYLLKPISQTDLTDTISKIIYRIEEKKETDRHEMLLRGSLKQSVFDAGAKHLELCLLGGRISKELVNMLGEQVVLVICVPFGIEGGEIVESIYALLEHLRDMTRHAVRHGKAIAALFMDSVVIAASAEAAGTVNMIDYVRLWSEKIGIPLAISWEEHIRVQDLKTRYECLYERLSYRFYHQEFCVLTEDDTRQVALNPDSFLLESAMQNGRIAQAYQELDQLISAYRNVNLPPEKARYECGGLYLRLAKYRNKESRETSITELLMKQGDMDFSGLAAMLKSLLHHWELDHSYRKIQTYSSQIKAAILYVEEHLADDKLSTSTVANQVLFLHPDYFSKLFKKETGMAFSYYVTDLRMEKAKNLIAQRPDIKVYELSEETGFGENAHYFSQVFRSRCGCTPSAFKKAGNYSEEIFE